MDLEQLRDKVARRRARISARGKELYRYARENGFNSLEAGALIGTSKETIDRLAEERDAQAMD